MALTEFVIDCDISTFEQALIKFRQACEDTDKPVHLSYHKGEFTLNYEKPALLPEEMGVHAQTLLKL